MKKEDLAGSVESVILQTPTLISAIAENITLTADNISLEGVITANQNFKILEDGSIETKNAKITGLFVSAEENKNRIMIDPATSSLSLRDVNNFKGAQLRWGDYGEANLLFANNQNENNSTITPSAIEYRSGNRFYLSSLTANSF